VSCCENLSGNLRERDFLRVMLFSECAIPTPPSSAFNVPFTENRPTRSTLDRFIADDTDGAIFEIYLPLCELYSCSIGEVDFDFIGVVG
jgi:hypothetical protein